MPVLSFKVSAEEARKIRQAARQKKTSVSAYLRSASLPEAPRPIKRIYKKNPISGLIVDATPGPMVTFEQIKEALADFP